MPYRAYRCMFCKEDDVWFSVLADARGKAAIIKHMDEVHDQDLPEEAFGD